MALFAADLKFEQGTHYSQIDTTKSQQPQVMEFFSFYCPACYNFEGVAQRLDQELPKGTFVKSHVNFLRGVTPKTQSMLSTAYLMAKQVGKGNEASSAIFDSIHQKRQRPNSLNDIRELFVLEKVMTGEQFDQLASNIMIIGQEQFMLEQQERFSKLNALTGVPTFIVNDIYRVELKSVKSYDELKALIEYLLKK
jgi:thiol:disulfide interchange protein DsbA